MIKEDVVGAAKRYHCLGKERYRMHIVTNQEITEKSLKNSKEEYKTLARQFEAILDHLPGMVFYKDSKNRFIRVNKYVADAHEKTKAELEGISLYDLYPYDVAQKYFDDDLEVINSGKGKLNITEPWETVDGKRWVNTSKIPFVNENDTITDVLGISFDVTDRIIAEQKLKILQQAVEQAPDSIVPTEPDGSICYVNKSFLELTGYEKEEALGKNPRILKLNTEAKLIIITFGKQYSRGKNGEVFFKIRKRMASSTGKERQ